MATIELIHKRVGNDIKIALALTDGGVAVDWTTVEKAKAFLVSDQQRVKMGDCRIGGPDAEDPTKLLMLYPASNPEYLGVARLVVSVTYHGHVSTFDTPLLVFVPSTAEEGTGTVEVEAPVTLDPENNNLEISVTDVDTSVLEQAITDAQEAAAAANEAADLATASAGRNPYIGENGHWYVWDGEAGEFVDTEISASGDSEWGNIQGNIERQTDLKNALDRKYEKPATGIPAEDLEDGVIPDVSDFYVKPNTGIPATDIADGVIPDVSDFITKTVNDLANYYLKSETYTQSEVDELIGAISQFHYEIAASTSAVTSPASNVLYLIGPTGSGADKYEEYVYANNTWTKIGDTSSDLSDYVTTTALSTALADYVLSSSITDVLRYSSQSLSDAQKTQARTNIGAGTYSKPSGGIPASDIESGVIPDAVEANPTVPSGTAPTPLTGLKIGSAYYDVSEEAMTNAEIDTAVNNAWV